MEVLITWVGATDHRMKGEGGGPVMGLLKDFPFQHVILLNNYPAEEGAAYENSFRKRFPQIAATLRQISMEDPTDLDMITRVAVVETERVLGAWPDAGIAYHTSPGTPAMAVVWFLLSETLFPKATLYQSSLRTGSKQVTSPVPIMDYLVPKFLEKPDRLMANLGSGRGVAEAFADIVAHSKVMKEQVDRAKQLAMRAVPVLITGPSGTGKELFAQAIHIAGPRKEKPMITVNCGAIPEGLIEAELFGAGKGAYTGADRDRKGLFREADGGTLFLDEMGELPLSAQVKLLRVVQQGEVMPVGVHKTTSVNVRVIAATNRNLPNEIEQGRFREDLFYRLAVGVIQLPSLTQRPEDLAPLVGRLLARINEESKAEPGVWPKELTDDGLALIRETQWPGNVRQLENTLWRAAIWSQGPQLDRPALEAALSVLQPGASNTSLLDRPLPVDINSLKDELCRHYLSRARQQAVSKTEAARLTGLKSYQVFDQQMRKCGLMDF